MTNDDLGLALFEPLQSINFCFRFLALPQDLSVGIGITVSRSFANDILVWVSCIHERQKVHHLPEGFGALFGRGRVASFDCVIQVKYRASPTSAGHTKVSGAERGVWQDLCTVR